ncbi:GMP-PDE, delta subunit-domain-containing protein [Blastocladiella britannica]|nr:GMP-PDE, delta subunit-domain-containing protein [Blastocladiella britannica]
MVPSSSRSKSPSLAKNPLSLEALAMAGGSTIQPSDVLAHMAPTKEFLVPFNFLPPLQFLEFCIKDKASGRVYFETKRPGTASDYIPLAPIELPPGMDPNDARTVEYTMSPQFLDCRDVSTSLIFAVGPLPIQSFRMIERHYFGDNLFKSYDFLFGFCIPNSVNTWESIYEVPPLSQTMREQLLQADQTAHVDSFYFVNNVLVMHHKASFRFVEN